MIDSSVWGANIVRWQLFVPDGTAYDKWIDSVATSLAPLDAYLPTLRAQGMFIIVDLHCVPGSCYSEGANETIYADPAFIQAMKNVWQWISVHYRSVRPLFFRFLLFRLLSYCCEKLYMGRFLYGRDEAHVFAYDLLNEPKACTKIGICVPLLLLHFYFRTLLAFCCVCV